jgi:tetratricopeptide (TPR) repeat protein
MKRIILLFTFLGMFSLSYAQLTLPPSGANQKSVVTQYIGALASVTITYNSPDVHGPNGQDRTGQIWGQLVPYGMTALGFGLNKPAPWRAGANENTTIEFSHDVLFQGEPIKAGKYGFFVVAKEEGPWEIILSHNHSAWGSFFYDPAEDALRVEAAPEDNEYREWLTYEFIDRQPERCTAALMWENIKLPFTIEVPEMTKLYAENIRHELQNAGGFSYMALSQAANFYAQNDLDLEQALAWAEQAVSGPFFGQRNFTTLQTKATVLDKLGRTEEAASAMDEAIKDPTATAFQIHQYGRQLIAQGKTEKALEVMQYNFERFEGAWPTHVSMARALSAAGQYEEALKHAEKALAQAPDPLNKQNLEQSVEKLKNKQDMN